VPVSLNFQILLIQIFSLYGYPPMSSVVFLSYSGIGLRFYNFTQYMNNNSASWQSISLGFIFIGLLVWGCIALFEQIIHAPWQFLSILIGLLGALITVTANYTTQIRNEQKDKKIEVYAEISECLGQMLYCKISNFQKPQEDLLTFTVRITPKLIMWGSDGVIKSFRTFLESSEPFLDFEKMMLEIRKDLGHSNSSEGQVIGIFSSVFNKINEGLETD
jgi:hypothetical protein